MAVNDVYRLSVDYTLGEQITSPVSGKTCFAPYVNIRGGTVTVTGGFLTNTELRATPVPVSGTVAATQSGTWNITNISGTVSLPTGASTEATALADFNGATATSRILSAAATTNATSAKASAGSVRTVTGYNARASAVYLKFYNKASAPTVGSDTPRKTVYLPATSAFCLDFRDYYATGIAYAMTTGGADADTGALTAGDILGLNVDYV